MSKRSSQRQIATVKRLLLAPGSGLGFARSIFVRFSEVFGRSDTASLAGTDTVAVDGLPFIDALDVRPLLTNRAVAGECNTP